MGVVAAAVAYVLARLILSTKTTVISHIDSQLTWTLMGGLYELARALPWLVGGAVTGYVCNQKPIQNGAITGAAFTSLFCLLGLVLVKLDPDAERVRLAQIGYPLVRIAESVVLFTLSSCFGFLLQTQQHRTRRE